MKDLTERTLLGNYFLESKRGSGKIAEVYKAWDNRKSVYVAVKVLRTAKIDGQDFYQYFSHEAELMSHLEHPNIVRFYEFCKDGNISFIVMDWVEGATLKDVITKKKAPLELGTVLMFLKPIASALNYAHSQKIIHCDIKPANILINQNSKVLLTDFGISKQVSQRTTGGTPPYMAPEQFTGEKLTPQTDIYGLGVTLYEMLSGGQVPYRGDTSQTRSTTLRDRIHWEVMNVPYPELSQYNRSIPKGVENAVKKALLKNPAQRFRSALDLANAIEQAADVGSNSFSEDDLHLLEDIAEPDGLFIQKLPHTQSYNDQAVGLPSIRKAQLLQRLPTNYSGVYLHVLQGEFEGLFIPIQENLFSIGRSSQSMLPLEERSVSRSHAVIHVTQAGVYIQDVGSKLGTIVNGQFVQDAYRLENGDVIQIGYEQVFEFYYK